jgi:hypothetical protein
MAPGEVKGPVVLAVVSPIPYMRLIVKSDVIEYELIGSKNKYAHEEVVDATKIDCLVGRITTSHGKCYIIERDTVVGQAEVVEEPVDPVDPD